MFPSHDHRSYLFTVNNPTEAELKLAKRCYDTAFSGSFRCVVQLECGENKTLHLQGVISFKNARSFTSVKQVLPRAHIERVHNLAKAIQYCQKVETRVEGPWFKGIRGPPRTISTESLYPWQKKIVDICENTPTERDIHWIWEGKGNRGKTALCKFLVVHKRALVLSGSAKDILFGVSTFVKENTEVSPFIFVFHFVRSQEDFISYQAIEAVKDGLFFSPKYESAMCVFDTPHVFVFANFAPDELKLSLDRWKITCIEE